jgi:uncharacterized protein (TIGR03067 family)
MKTLICTALVFLCALVPLHGDEKDKEKPKDNDLERLQGTWRVVSLTEEGKAVVKEVADTIEIVIDKDTFTASEKGVVGAKYSITLEPNKSPKQIDFKHLIGESKGGVEPGIYQFEKDQVRMILDEKRKGRPTVFEGKETASYSVIVLEKKPAKDKDAK